MGSVYGFWRQINKDQKQAKMRYIEMLYSLLFRKLVSILSLQQTLMTKLFSFFNHSKSYYR